MRAALVGASDFNREHFLQQRFPYVVAVDGGLASVRDAGAYPDVVVGDFDSLGYVPHAADVRCFPCEKDESDLELACRVAHEDGACDELVLYGCLGRRLDHTLANLQVMLAHARAGRRVFAIGDDYAVALICGQTGRPGRLRFQAIDPAVLASGSQGAFVSVFAQGGVAHGVRESGLKYALDGADVRDDVSLGLSNEFTGAPAAIEVESGALLVVFPLAAWEYIADEGDFGGKR